ncbi:MAG: 30S ribosomal protein S27e [Candidatus Methanomethylicaceae archaeon]|nr:30S ribosomal protein S27e [Candidatus Verstraetearchaeota archaeon]
MKKRKILTPMPKSKFLKVKCLDCGNEQIIFSHASTIVRCNICNKELAIATGGKAKILTDKIKEILE